MPKLTINGTEIEVAAGTSVLQACEALGIEVPRFCYHERLSVPANCRMCLVEVEKAPKPVASCAMPCSDGMVVKTDSPLVHRARKGVLEFLLINHPLDCPICDQGGECDLQDQTMAYGYDRSRFAENKRAVTDKELGPLIKTVMTRCIHCTRCVRFADEVAGMPEMGMTGRGEDVEIGTYIQKAVSSELSGNMIDICPVGALTNKPYAFAARPWELTKTESIDVLDAVGSNIRIDSRGPQVLRVLPRLHEDVNEEWISDKTRFACDGLLRQRLDQPYVRRDGRLQPVSWDEALRVVAERLQATGPERIAALAGDLVELESMFALMQLLRGMGVQSLDCRQDGALYDVAHPAGLLFNTGIAGIEQADAILLVGTNPRHEATMLNARIRKRWLRGGLKVGRLGPVTDLTYPVHELGSDPRLLEQLAVGQGLFSDILREAKWPLLIVGAAALARDDGAAIQGVCRAIGTQFAMVREGWNGFNVLQAAAARVGGILLGFLPQADGRTTRAILEGCQRGDIETLYLLGADEIEASALGQTFVIYQGHHGDRGAHRADVILPGAAYTEKHGTYVNIEGRVQTTRQAVFPPGAAREDWKIVRALSAVLQRALPYDSLADLRRAMVAAYPWLSANGERITASWAGFGQAGPISGQAFSYPVLNYYMTDPISRASATMAACSRELRGTGLAEAAE